MFFAAIIHILLALLGYGVSIGVQILEWFNATFAFWGKFPSDIPPGSMGWPLIGDTLAFIHPHNSNCWGKYLKERCSRYGLVFKCRLFGAPTIVSCDLDLNNFILQNEGKLFSSNYPKQIVKAIGEETILFVSGQLHKRLRNVVLSFIHTTQISPEFISYIDHTCITMMDSWKQKKEIDFPNEAKLFTFHLILKRLLDMDRGDAKAATIQQDAFTVWKGVISLPVNIPGTSGGRVGKARSRLFSTITEIMNERRKSAQKDTFIDEFLKKDEWNEEEKVRNVLSFLLGGFETTAQLLALAVYFLARSPRALQQLKEEHKYLRRNKKELGVEALSLEDYKQMDFTIKVINETLRCGNVAKYVFRKALKDIKYKQFLIPKGWHVIPYFAATNLNPTLHENPSEFNPWRWDNEETSRKVISFGGGSRLCPGTEFAKLSTAFFLHHFVLKFSWKIRDDECPISCPDLVFKRELLIQIQPTMPI